MRFMFFRFRECNGCRLCELACSVAIDGRCGPERSVIRVLDADIAGSPIPVVTGSCSCDPTDAPCLEVCVRKAIKLFESFEIGQALADGWTQCAMIGVR